MVGFSSLCIEVLISLWISPCFPRTIHLLLAASPCSRLSRPRSTISQSDFHQAVGPSSPCQLVRSYRLSSEPDGLPCSHEILWLHAGGTNPGSLPDAHRVVPGNTAFPIER